MALTIPPVTPISTVAPVNSASTPPVLVPPPGQTNTGKFLEENLLKELNQNGNNAINPRLVLPLPGQTDTGNFLEKNLLTALNDNGDNNDQSDLIENIRNSNINSPARSIIEQNNNVSTFANDNTPTITNADTPLSLDSVVILQQPQALVENDLSLANSLIASNNIYAFIINAMQGGANSAFPTKDIENRTEFEV